MKTLKNEILPAGLLILPALFTCGYLTSATQFDSTLGIIMCGVVIPVSMVIGFLMVTLYLITWLDIPKKHTRDMAMILVVWFLLSLILTVNLILGRITSPWDSIFFGGSGSSSIFFIMLWLIWGVLNIRATWRMRNILYEPVDPPMLQYALGWSWLAYTLFTISSICLTLIFLLPQN